MTDRSVRVKLSANVGDYTSSVDRAASKTDRLHDKAKQFSNGKYEAKIGADTTAAKANMSALERRLAEYAARSPEARVNLDSDEARSRLTRLQARLTDFGSEVATAKARVDDADSLAKLSRIEAQLLRVGSATAEPSVDLAGIAAAESDLAGLTSQLRRFDGNDYSATVHVDGTLRARREMRSLTAAAIALGPALIPVTAVATAGMLALSGAAGAAATGAGTAALAFTGVGDALQKMNKAQLAAASNAAEMAQAQQQAARQVADARRGLAQAHRNAAQAAQAASEQVADARRAVVQAEEAQAEAAAQGARDIAEAKRRVAQARREAAQAAQQASERVEDAEQALAQAHQQVRFALEDLHQARQQAIRDLKELREQTRDLALSEEAAEIALIEARKNLQEVTSQSASSELELRDAKLDLAEAERKLLELTESGAASALELRRARLDVAAAERRVAAIQEDSTATSLELRKARLRVAEAEDQLSDVHRRTRRTQAALTEAERKGVANADVVVAARRDVAEAQRGVAEAAEQLREAQANAARVQAQSARQIREAVRGVAEARRQAAQRNEQAAQQVAEAQRALARAEQDAAAQRAAAARRVEAAQRAVSRALADASKAMREQSTEAENLAQAMAKLSPAGREFVRFLDSLQPKLKELQAVAQAGLFPGVEKGIRELLVIFPDIKRLVDNTATALGELAASAGDALNNPFWRNFIDFIAAEAGPTLTSFGRILGNVAKGFAGMMMAFDPLADDLVAGLERISAQFAHWGATLSTNKGFQQFVDYVRQVTPQVLDTLGAVAGAIGAIVQAAAPVGTVVLAGLESLADILNTIASIPYLGTGLVAFASGLVLVNQALRAHNRVKASALAITLASMGPAGSRAARGLRAASRAFWPVAVAVGAVTTAVNLAQPSLNDYVRSVERAGGAHRTTGQKIRALEQELRKQQAIVSDAMFTVGNWGLAWNRSALELNTAARKSDLLKARIKRLREQADLTSPRVQVMADKFNITAIQASDTLDAVNRLDTELQAFFDLSFGVQEAQDRVTRGYRQLEKQVRQTSGRLRGNSDAAIDNRRQMRLLVRDIGSLMVEERKHADSLVELKRKTQDNIDRFRAYARRIGLNEQQVETYTDALRAARIDVINQFKTPGLDRSIRRTRDLYDLLGTLEGTYNFSVRTPRNMNQYIRGLAGRAAGGPIEGVGTGTSDSNVIRASKGEHMWTAEEVSRAGGHGAVKAMREAALGGAKLPGFAQGGPVTPRTVGTYHSDQMAWLGELLGNLQRPMLQGRTGAYNGVLPYVAAVGDLVDRRFPGVYSIGGRAPRSNPSDHPKGLALDFMVPAFSAVGDRVSRFLMSQWRRFNIEYLIWSQRIWNPPRTYWRSMEDRGGVTANHYDHVHASFLAPYEMDRGGRWPSGTSAVNRSGDTEAVLTGPQWRAIENLASAVSKPIPVRGVATGGDGAVTPVYHREAHYHITTQRVSEPEIRAFEHGEAARERVGRPS